jgi:hypothetical protein
MVCTAVMMHTVFKLICKGYPKASVLCVLLQSKACLGLL